MKIRPVEDELFRADEQEDRRTDISKLIVVIRNLAKAPNIYIYIYIYIQGVPGGMDKTSGECSLC